jgi:hypothetical protein
VIRVRDGSDRRGHNCADDDLRSFSFGYFRVETDGRDCDLKRWCARRDGGYGVEQRPLSPVTRGLVACGRKQGYDTVILSHS